MIDYVDSLGMPVLIHSCGCIYDYFDLLAETRAKSIHPLQRTAGMDLGWVKREYGKRFCLVGNIDSSRTLPYGSVEDVRVEVREAIAAAAGGGGFILASDHSLHDGLSVENIQAMFDGGMKVGSRIYTR